MIHAPWPRGGAAASGTSFRIVPVLLCAALALAACALTDSRIKTKTVEIEVAPNANADNALAVDLVFVHENTLLPSFTEMPSANWFKNREQLKLANPTGIEVHSFEVIPGQKGPRFKVEGRANDALGAFVFAGYDTPGPHRARIDGIPTVVLRLGEKDFAVAAPAS
ncbi:hypothetical protein [Azospirillum soli]|uniref:hypothetical protein n=1 Tax=Azospirillum soli TaxID=1304799 RepID=UPI001AE9DB63|nr:hypothetical protein [Azospirillum soli]MBP2312798.1 type VI secretion system protein [Azospirillum soli]